MAIEAWGEKEFKLVGLIIFLIAGGIFLYTLHVKFRAERQSRWPTVIGQVTQAQFEERVRTSRRNGRTHEERYWIPHFSYVYQVSGATFTSTQISSFDSTCETQSQVTDLRGLVKNNRAMVFYNPASPGEAVIQPLPSQFTMWFFLIISPVCSLIGLFLFWSCRWEN